MRNTILFLICCSLSLAACPCCSAQDGQGVRNAVAAVKPRLVRIDTIGGREKVGNEFANEGTGTGVLLDKDGYVITAAFLFLHEPTSIILRFDDGSKKVAKKICTDKNRMLTLLKADQAPVVSTITETPLPPVGERCIAVGVALSETEPNIAMGIISGTNRIWGKAIQTDAAVSPNNYGGPLIDGKGDVLGILVPLSMMSDDLTAGADQYDGGVGTAIPLIDILKLLPRYQKGNDLSLGFVGISLKENKTFVGSSVIDGVLPGSPADKAGIKKGDKIISINGKAVNTAMELSIIVRSCYADEKMTIKLQRNGKEETVELTPVFPPKKEAPKPKPGQRTNAETGLTLCYLPVV